MIILLALLEIILMWMNKHWEKTRKILTSIFSVYFIFTLINSKQTDVVNVNDSIEKDKVDENEKLYYVEEIGPLIVRDLTAHFKKDHDIAVYFKYEDGSTMASQKNIRWLEN